MSLLLAAILTGFDIAGIVFLARNDPNIIPALLFHIAPWQ
jgi:hypothetical protein